MPTLEDRLRKLYMELPEHVRPPLKHGYRWLTLHGSALAERKRVVDSRRIEFLDFEIANLEPWGFLGPSAGEVLVETRVSLVSPGTERGILTGLPGTARRFPFRPGYSAAGVVRAVGPGVTRFAPGDRVAGGIAHASRVNVGQDFLVKTPANVSDEEASFVVLGMIAQQGIRKAAILPGERVAVVGQGLLGQLGNRLVRILTPGRLVGVGASRRREEVARTGGVDDYVALTEKAFDPSAVAADVVIEIAGTPDSMATALACAAPGGRVVVVGSTRALDRHVDWRGVVQAKGLRIVGAHVSIVPSADASPTRWTFVQEIGLFLDLIARRQLQVSDLVTARPSPEECNDVYDRLTRFPSEHIGIAFQWSGATNGAAKPTRRPSTPLAGDQGRTMEPLRIGVVGTGAIGRHNALSVRQSPAAKIVGVFDTNLKVARSVANDLSAKVHESYEALLADPEIEAVLLAVPHHLHRDLTIQAAASGKHLLLEKPLANTVEEANAMLAACRRAGTLSTVNFSYRYLPQFRAARALVEAGAVGEITGVQVAAYSYREHGYWFGARSQSVDDWRTDKTKAGAGFLFMNLCHVIDYIHFITGLKTERVYAEYGTLGSPTEVEDSVSISCRFGNGAIGSFSGSTIRRGANESEDRIWGTHGSIAIVGETVSYYSTRPINGTRPGRTHKQRYSRNNLTAEWISGFANAVRSSGTPAITLRDGWENIAFIEAALKSMEEGRALSVPAFEEQ